MDLPVAYMSRVLVGPELNYYTTEKECLAVLHAVNQFRPYIYERKFTLMSDHEPLRWINLVKDPGQRLSRWRLKLRDYEYEFKYKPGKLNTNVDALSRNPIVENSDEEGEEEKQPARLLPMLTMQANKREENSSKLDSRTLESEAKNKPVVRTRNGLTSRIETSKPSTSRPQKPTLARSKPSASTSAELVRSTIAKRLIRRRAETQRAQNRPDYKDDSCSEETERDQEPPPILRKRKSVLQSLDFPPAAYPSSTITKSALAKAPECFTEFFPEDQEESTPTTKKQEADPVKMVIPPPSDSDDSTTEGEQEKDQVEHEKSKSTKENIKISFSRFEQSLKAHEDWLERTEMDKEAPLLEVTAVSERENNQEFLDATEEIEPESETDFTDRIESVIRIAEELLKETQEKGKAVNSESKENLYPGISSSDEEVSARNLPGHTRKCNTFDPGIALTPDALGKYIPSALREPKAIPTPFPEKLTQEFVQSKIEITICYGNVNIPSEEIHTQIISENHKSKIGGHKEINKKYRDLEKDTCGQDLRIKSLNLSENATFANNKKL